MSMCRTRQRDDLLICASSNGMGRAPDPSLILTLTPHLAAHRQDLAVW